MREDVCPKARRWGAAYSRARPNAQRRHKDRFMCERYDIERCKVWLELERATCRKHGCAGGLKDQSRSVNLPLTSAANASITSFACLPVASTVMVVPGPAPSIMSPMIEVPPTTSCPRLTLTSASNFSTVCTNLADARACNPLLLQISSTRVTASPSPV